MSTSISRRAFLIGLGAVTIASGAQANAPLRSLRPQMRGPEIAAVARGGAESVIARGGLRGEVACVVADAKTGLRLESVQGDQTLPPASVAKSITALYALDTLGADYRFQTRLMATGPVKNGILQGDLILAGGGDPTLDTNQLATMAANLKSAGLREVRGKFRVYDGALPYVRSIDEQQPDHVGYSPGVSGIALNFNRVHFEWKQAGRGYSVAMDARSDRYRPEVATATMQVVNRQLPVYTYADLKGIDQWTVASTALGKGGSRWLPVRNPAAYAGDVFRTMARAQGIVLKPAEETSAMPNGATALVVHQSDDLRAILKDMLTHSTNVTAEMVGMTASAARGGTPNTLEASGLRMSKWAADTLGMRASRLVDHSGLNDASHVSADDLVGALVKAYGMGNLKPLLKPFPMRDKNGKINRAHPIRVDAKTGTLNFVSALGGFMTSPDGTELAFAILTADTATRSRIKRSDREVPDGARSWNRTSKQLQQKLIERWGALYGS